MKKEHLEEILEKLMQMEDAEENLEMVPLYEEALQLSREIYGEYHLKTLEIYNNYGGHLRNLGLYEKAEEILHCAVACARVVRGMGHPDYATSLVNLANLLRMMKIWEESEEIFQKALDIYKRTIGEEHFIYAGTMNNLGLLYFEEGKYEKAKECLQKSLSILDGKEEYMIPYAITLHNLVDIYKKEGNVDKAEDTLNEEIRIYKEMKYEGTVLYAAALNSLSSLYCEKEQYEMAEKLMEESVEIARVHLGKDSEAYKIGAKNLEWIRKMRRKSLHPVTVQCSFENHGDVFVKGMDLCRAYFHEIGMPLLEREFSRFLPRMAAGLIGEGSECYGFDDEISRDHDFGPSFQIFIPAEDMPVYGERLANRLRSLPVTFHGFEARTESQYGEGRVGLFTIEDFYGKFLACEGVPKNLNHWRQIPENALSTVTNGEVFLDNLGKFTSIRDELKKGYPEDVRLKKIAARLMKMAQSGQYNFPRCNKRGEYVASHLALSEFMSVTMSLVYLLNHSYRPYYKWVHRGLLGLPVLGEKIYEKMNRLSVLNLENDAKEMEWIIEEICALCLKELKNQGLTSSSEPFLLIQGPEVLKRIKTPELRNSNPWIE